MSKQKLDRYDYAGAFVIGGTVFTILFGLNHGWHWAVLLYVYLASLVMITCIAVVRREHEGE